ncbi:MAG: DNA polymerase III subunit delta, partial [Mariprofundaceae bacterium]
LQGAGARKPAQPLERGSHAALYLGVLVRLTPTKLLNAGQDFYYLYGEDADALFEAGESLLLDGDAEVHRFDVSEVGRIEVEANNQGLFGNKRRHMLIRNAESANAKQLKLLQNYAARQWADARIILCAPHMEARKALHKHMLAADGVAHCGFSLLSGEDFSRWLRQEVEEHGLQLDEQAFALLSESLTGMRQAAKNALDRLQLYQLGRVGTLGVKEVAALIGEHAPEDIGHYCDAVCGRSTGALALLQALLQNQKVSEVQVLSWLQTRLQQMLMYKWFASTDKHNAARRARLFGEARNCVPRQTGAWESTELIEAVGKVVEAEKLLKGASVESNGMVLERLTLALLGDAQAPAA